MEVQAIQGIVHHWPLLFAIFLANDEFRGKQTSYFLNWSMNWSVFLCPQKT